MAISMAEGVIGKMGGGEKLAIDSGVVGLHRSLPRTLRDTRRLAKAEDRRRDPPGERQRFPSKKPLQATF
jgi:hypothetical protein